MFIPTVTGIYATDYNGNICAMKNGELVTIAQFAMPSVRSLDRVVLRGLLHDLPDPLFVLGRNTHEQMGFMLGSHTPCIITDEKTISGRVSLPSDYELIRKPFEEFNASNPSKEDVMRTTPTLAMMAAIRLHRNIVVLGGESVYKAFDGQYTHIYHSVLRYLNDESLTGTKTLVTLRPRGTGISAYGGPVSRTNIINTPEYSLTLITP